MSQNELDAIIEKLNGERFYKLENFEIGTVLCVLLHSKLNDKSKILKISKKNLIIELLFNMLTKKVRIMNKKGNKLFLFSNAYWERADHRASFNKVYNLAKDSVLISHGFSISMKNFFCFYKFYKWYRSLKKYFSKEESLFIAVELLNAYTDFSFIKKEIDKKKYRVFTTLCDVHPVDCMSVQYCNHLDIDTCTLQHANLLGFSFKYSLSKYFLGFGQYSQDIAKENQYKGTFYKMGFPKEIGNIIPNSMTINNFGIIGVVFSDFNTKFDDLNMLKIVMKYAKANNIKVYVKLHPATKIDDYTGVEWNKVEQICGKETTIDDFKNRIDIAVISNSTVFSEYTFALFPAILYKCKLDRYQNITWCKFWDEKTFDNLMKVFYNDKDFFAENMKQTRLYFSDVKNIKENYQNFYKKYDDTL
ncbi:hypothetical protein [Treponema pectinovorum]|uniref:hypothetical protein n=1 Tax=Treponema pectinovorum TaxID=164 RepID=UPI0011CA217F|nr:hypothetical protein [Treponema pectinovorum]